MAVLVKELWVDELDTFRNALRKRSDTLSSKTATEKLGLGTEPDVGLFGPK